MNKLLKMILPLLVVGLITGTSFVRGDYNVTVGNTFNYDVGACTWDITFGGNSSAGTGFNFLEVKRAVGTTFVVEVTDVDAALGVEYDMTIGTDTDSSSNSPFDIIGLVLMLILPVFFAESTASMDWNQTDLDQGPELMTLFFVDPVTWSDFFYEVTQEEFITSISDPAYEFVNVGGTFDNTTAIAVFTWHFDMTYSTVGYDFSGTYVLIYAFDKTTGQMKGIYLDMNYSGTVDSKALTYIYKQKVEEVGYNIPGAGGFIPGFGWLAAFPTLAMLGGIAILLRKRK